MTVKELKEITEAIYFKINENKDYLTRLDQESGDGDLGISMVSGFQAVKNYMETTEEADLGRALNKCGDVFNEAAPSSLGTILTFFLKGMAKNLKGCSECGLDRIAEALQQGIENIMKKRPDSAVFAAHAYDKHVLRDIDFDERRTGRERFEFDTRHAFRNDNPFECGAIGKRHGSDGGQTFRQRNLGKCRTL